MSLLVLSVGDWIGLDLWNQRNDFICNCTVFRSIIQLLPLLQLNLGPYQIYTVSQKWDHYAFAHILGKYGSIFKILSQLHQELDLLNYRTGFHGNRFRFRQ
jgi:hypothetical protein